MENILRFIEINKLKNINRANSVGERHESPSEHSWSSLLLADYYQSQITQELNILRVYNLIMYHDLVEIITGDNPLLSNISIERKIETENVAADILRKKLPDYISNKFYDLYVEFGLRDTIESRYANAIDKLDPVFHELDYKSDWKGFTKEFLISKKLKYFEEFIPIKRDFLKCIDYMDVNGYFD